MEEPQIEAKCRLLSIAGELRNQIYEYALLEDGTIKVDKNNCHQPALLRTCHQIKTEAASIYYLHNSFEFEDKDFSLKSYYMFLKHMQDCRDDLVQEFSPVITIASWFEPVWENIKAWISHHIQYKTCFSLSRKSDLEAVVFEKVSYALQLARNLHLGGVQWEVIESALEIYKKATQDSVGWL